MACEVSGHHDEEERRRNGNYGYEVGFEADEGANGKEGQGIRRFSPCEDTLQAVLEHEYYTYSIGSLSIGCFRVGERTHLALKRRKLLVIKGSEKPGLLMYFELLTSGARSNSLTSSSGMNCCKSLRSRRLARHFLNGPLIAAARQLTW